MNQTIDLSRTEKDWILGGIGAFSPQKINPSGDWRPYVPPFKLQRAIDGDTDACTVFSAWNALWMISKFKGYGDLDKSDSFTAVDAGNVRGVGNSFNNTDESIRLHWSVPESEKPFNPAMTLDDFYTPNTDQMQQDALADLVNYTVNWGWLTPSDSPTPEEIATGLQESPIRCAVQGNYSNRDADGRILNIPGYAYNHAVTMVYKNPDNSTIVFDSENMTFDIFAPGYQFKGCKVFNLEKKTPMATPKIYKQVNSPALYFKHWSQDVLIPVADGVLVGGDLFKTLLGSDDYASIPRVKNASGQDWQELPFPVATYSFITK